MLEQAQGPVLSRSLQETTNCVSPCCYYSCYSPHYSNKPQSLCWETTSVQQVQLPPLGLLSGNGMHQLWQKGAHNSSLQDTIPTNQSGIWSRCRSSLLRLWGGRTLQEKLPQDSNRRQHRKGDGNAPGGSGR